jgi:ATP-binding cassette subfamily B protein
VTQESLRAAIAVVPQDISLFHRSIMENIRYGRPDASDADVHAAIVAANCDDFIKNLPEGVATIVGEGRPRRLPSLLARAHSRPVLAGDNPETIVLDLVQPLAARRQVRGFCRKARRDEPGREGTLQHVS